MMLPYIYSRQLATNLKICGIWNYLAAKDLRTVHATDNYRPAYSTKKRRQLMD